MQQPKARTCKGTNSSLTNKHNVIICYMLTFFIDLVQLSGHLAKNLSIGSASVPCSNAASLWQLKTLKPLESHFHECKFIWKFLQWTRCHTFTLKLASKSMHTIFCPLYKDLHLFFTLIQLQNIAITFHHENWRKLNSKIHRIDRPTTCMGSAWFYVCRTQGMRNNSPSREVTYEYTLTCMMCVHTSRFNRTLLCLWTWL